MSVRARRTASVRRACFCGPLPSLPPPCSARVFAPIPAPNRSVTQPLHPPHTRALTASHGALLQRRSLSQQLASRRRALSWATAPGSCPRMRRSLAEYRELSLAWLKRGGRGSSRRKRHGLQACETESGFDARLSVTLRRPMQPVARSHDALTGQLRAHGSKRGRRGGAAQPATRRGRNRARGVQLVFSPFLVRPSSDCLRLSVCACVEFCP